MALFDGTKAYLDQKTNIERIGNIAVDFSNLCDVVYARAGVIVQRAGNKTAAELVNMGVPDAVAADVVKVVEAAARIRDAIAAEVAAGNLRSGQFTLS